MPSNPQYMRASQRAKTRLATRFPKLYKRYLAEELRLDEQPDNADKKTAKS